MNLILTTFSSNEHYNADIDFAFVELTPALAAIILKRRAALLTISAQDSETKDTRYWDSSPRWLAGDSIPEDVCYDEEVQRLSAPVVLKDPLPTELEQMVLMPDGVSWRCSPKHSDIYLDTATIPYALIEEAAGLDTVDEHIPVVVEATRFVCGHNTRLGTATVVQGPPYVVKHFEPGALGIVAAHLAESGHTFSVRLVDRQVSVLEYMGIPVDKIVEFELGLLEPFCACGRRHSDCDGSRKACCK